MLIGDDIKIALAKKYIFKIYLFYKCSIAKFIYYIVFFRQKFWSETINCNFKKIFNLSESFCTGVRTNFFQPNLHIFFIRISLNFESNDITVLRTDKSKSSNVNLHQKKCLPIIIYLLFAINLFADVIFAVTFIDWQMKKCLLFLLNCFVCTNLENV